eukprot:TRINITY_DN23128_c0_g1_i1.p1 TRINITY_DN23128_c0_g1~~TRINITY_DN23128_c0_g1_i1.p1  ORF type:complete len:154 (+),score=22.04 TRINITY_DN23128_c0_g1_i1:78-539(+)
MPRWKGESSGFAKSIQHAPERAGPGLHEIQAMKLAVHPSEREMWMAHQARNPPSPVSDSSGMRRALSQADMAQSGSSPSGHVVSPVLAQTGQASVPGTPTSTLDRPDRPEIGAPGNMTIQIVRDRTGHMNKHPCSSPNFNYMGRFQQNAFGRF